MLGGWNLVAAEQEEVIDPVVGVKSGDAVTIHGLRARNLPLVQAMQVSNDAGGATATDTGPGKSLHGSCGPDARFRGPVPPSSRR